MPVISATLALAIARSLTCRSRLILRPNFWQSAASGRVNAHSADFGGYRACGCGADGPGATEVRDEARLLRRRPARDVAMVDQVVREPREGIGRAAGGDRKSVV